MLLTLNRSNVDELLSCVGDYINQELDVELRDFVVSLNLDHLNSGYIYTSEWGLQPYACPKFDGPLHTHDDLSDCHVFCTRLEVLVLLFLKNSLYHERHGEVIETLHEWLPSASAHIVDVLFDDCATTPHANIVNSYFEPSYAYKFVHTPTDYSSLTYHYITSNIEYTSYCISENNKTIMVRARSRSRSRSPGRRRRPGRPRSRSRSRSRSSSRRCASPTTMRPYRRRRSRSRSTSRSRY